MEEETIQFLQKNILPLYGIGDVLEWRDEVYIVPGDQKYVKFSTEQGDFVLVIADFIQENDLNYFKNELKDEGIEVKEFMFIIGSSDKCVAKYTNKEVPFKHEEYIDDNYLLGKI